MRQSVIRCEQQRAWAALLYGFVCCSLQDLFLGLASPPVCSFPELPFHIPGISIFLWCLLHLHLLSARFTHCPLNALWPVLPMDDSKVCCQLRSSQPHLDCGCSGF